VTLRVSPRLAGVACVIVGVWFAVLVPPHPDIVRHDVAHGVLASGTWRLAHAWMFLTGIAGIGAAAGIVAVHGRRLGRAGDVALAVMLVSAVATSAAGLLEAAVFPFLARTQPDAIAFDGPIFTAPLFRALSGPWLLFPLVFAALGWLATRAGDYAAAGSALAATGIGFFALGMWFVPFAGVASSVALGGVLCWWGVILWRAASSPT
jgi:hypothetical protein